MADVCSDIDFVYVDTRLSRHQSVFTKQRTIMLQQKAMYDESVF